jgi:hypothetical protein
MRKETKVNEVMSPCPDFLDFSGFSTLKYPYHQGSYLPLNFLHNCFSTANPKEGINV